MIEQKTSLFSDFSKTSEQEWVAKIEKDLKGKPLSVLDYSPESGIDFMAYAHPDSSTTPPTLHQATADWFIQRHFKDQGKSTNKAILDGLLSGTTALYLKVKNDSPIEEWLSDVKLEYVNAEFKTDGESWKHLYEFLESRPYSQVYISNSPLTNQLCEGTFGGNLDDFHTYYSTFKGKALKSIHIDGYTFGEVGASTIQELAISLALMSEYVQHLKSKGEDVSEVLKSVYTTLSVNDDYFLNMAKFRAYKLLVVHFAKEFEVALSINDVEVNAVTNVRHMAKNDHYNNLLRATTQAMSAILGGCKNLRIQPFSDLTGTEEVLSERMAVNIQLILKEESYFDKVSDPAAGSYHIERLTNQLIEKAWDLFLSYENEGGYQSNIQNNRIQNEIESNTQLLVNEMNEKKRTFLGINKFPNPLEEWMDVQSASSTDGKEFKALKPFYLENEFTKSADQ